MDAALDRLRDRPAAEICGGCELEGDFTALLERAPEALAFLRMLLAAGAGKDAARFLCHALPPRAAVWLAWDAAAQVHGDGAASPVAAALAATGAWLAEPTDAHRRAALPAAEACGLEQPAGCAAMAVFLAAGSLAPAGLADVPPPIGACAKAAAGALVLAAVRDPARAEARAAGYVERWLALAAMPSPPWTPST